MSLYFLASKILSATGCLYTSPISYALHRSGALPSFGIPIDRLCTALRPLQFMCANHLCHSVVSEDFVMQTISFLISRNLEVHTAKYWHLLFVILKLFHLQNVSL